MSGGFRLSLLGFAGFSLVAFSGCSGVGLDAKVDLSINRSLLTGTNPSGPATRSLRDDIGNDYALPPDLCYVVHVSAPDLNQIDGADNSCIAKAGAGKFYGSYRVGEVATLVVPAGPNRRFEIVGFVPKAPNLSGNGQPTCGPLSAAKITGPDGVPQMEFRIDGQPVELVMPALFAAGNKDIFPGENLVTLFALPKPKSMTAWSSWPYEFGEPWLRSDTSGGATLNCAAGDNPWRDRDGDGVADGEELRLGYDPDRADSDGDQIPDGIELTLGTNPLVADSDGDGVPDGYEVSFGTNPLLTSDRPALFVGWSTSYFLPRFGATYFSMETAVASSSYRLNALTPSVGLGASGTNFKVFLEY